MDPLAPRPAPIHVPSGRGTELRMRKLPRMAASRRFMGAANLNNMPGDLGPAKQIVRPLQRQRVAIKPQGEFDTGDLSLQQALRNISTTRRHHEPTTRRRLPVVFGETKRGDIHDAAVEAFGGADNLPHVPARPHATLHLNPAASDAHSSLVSHETDRTPAQAVASTVHPAASASAPHHDVAVDGDVRVATHATASQTPAVAPSQPQSPTLHWTQAGVEAVSPSLAALPSGPPASGPRVRTDGRVVVDERMFTPLALSPTEHNIWAPPPVDDLHVVDPSHPRHATTVSPLRDAMASHPVTTHHATLSAVSPAAVPADPLAVVAPDSAVVVREPRLLRDADPPGVVTLYRAASGAATEASADLDVRHYRRVRERDPLAHVAMALEVGTRGPAHLQLQSAFSGVDRPMRDALVLGSSHHGRTQEPSLRHEEPLFAGVEFARHESPTLAISHQGRTHEPALRNEHPTFAGVAFASREPPILGVSHHGRTQEPALLHEEPTFAGVEFARRESPVLGISHQGRTEEPAQRHEEPLFAGVEFARRESPVLGISHQGRTEEPAQRHEEPLFAGVEFTRHDMPVLGVHHQGLPEEPRLDGSVSFQPTHGLPGTSMDIAALPATARHEVLSKDDPLLGSFRAPQLPRHASALDTAVRHPVRVDHSRPTQPSWSPWQASPFPHVSTGVSSAQGVAGGTITLSDRALPSQTAPGARAARAHAHDNTRAPLALGLSPDVDPSSPRRRGRGRDAEHARPPMAPFHTSVRPLDTSNHPRSPHRQRRLSAAHRRLRM